MTSRTRMRWGSHRQSTISRSERVRSAASHSRAPMRTSDSHWRRRSVPRDGALAQSAVLVPVRGLLDVEGMRCREETGRSEDSLSQCAKPSPQSPAATSQVIGRLVDAAERLGGLRHLGSLRIHERFAVGGMASLHLGWAVGLGRIVAVKRLHQHLLVDETFTKMLLDEARLAMHIAHPNVIAMLGVVRHESELLLAMDYVPGATLAEILAAVQPSGLEPSLATAILFATLQGLHAAHEARGTNGERLGVVHRDVTPQNVLLGQDGITRVLDFGIAKAEARLQSTLHPIVKGKLPYLSPEQLTNGRVDHRSDIYSAAVVLWEALTGRPLFHEATVKGTLRKILFDPIAAPSRVVPTIPTALDAIVSRGLARDPGARYQSARDMALDLERALPMASAQTLAERLSALNMTVVAARGRQVDAVRRREGGASASRTRGSRR